MFRHSLLDRLKQRLFAFVKQGEDDTSGAKPAATSRPVYVAHRACNAASVGAELQRDVVVDDERDAGDVDPPGQRVGGDENAGALRGEPLVAGQPLLRWHVLVVPGARQSRAEEAPQPIHIVGRLTIDDCFVVGTPYFEQPPRQAGLGRARVGAAHLPVHMELVAHVARVGDEGWLVRQEPLPNGPQHAVRDAGRNQQNLRAVEALREPREACGTGGVTQELVEIVEDDQPGVGGQGVPARREPRQKAVRRGGDKLGLGGVTLSHLHLVSVEPPRGG